MYVCNSLIYEKTDTRGPLVDYEIRVGQNSTVLCARGWAPRRAVVLEPTPMAASAARCHYEVLAVERDVGDDELKKAYRKLALQVRHCAVRTVNCELCLTCLCVVDTVAPRQEPGASGARD